MIPSINNGDTSGLSENFGQAAHFYRFLKTELLPFVGKKFKVNTNNNSLIGHSFGGLFVFYWLFKNEDIFRHYYALSPSLWINNYDIYKFNKLYTGAVPRTLYFSADGLEVINFIKPGADRMKSFLDSHQYKNLQYRYQVHKGESHNSQVEKSLSFILAE
ncbi:MAG: alpha/beta hydrolase-fold protein [Ferruginibacter sp.]